MNCTTQLKNWIFYLSIARTSREADFRVKVKPPSQQTNEREKQMQLKQI